MTTSSSGRQDSRQSLPSRLPPIRLRLGQVLWILAQMGFQGNATKSTFYEYLKSLRKLGTPFPRGEPGYERKGRANYSYCHLAELALMLMLTLRVYHVVPDAVLAEIVRHRRTLYRHYRRAYLDRASGLGAPMTIDVAGQSPLIMRGAFLDLQLNFSGGTLTGFGPPRLISPYEALRLIIGQDLAARAFLPLNLSLLSERLVSAALQAPPVRTGPQPTAKRKTSTGSMTRLS